MLNMQIYFCLVGPPWLSNKFQTALFMCFCVSYVTNEGAGVLVMSRVPPAPLEVLQIAWKLFRVTFLGINWHDVSQNHLLNLMLDCNCEKLLANLRNFEVVRLWRWYVNILLHFYLSFISPNLIMQAQAFLTTYHRISSRYDKPPRRLSIGIWSCQEEPSQTPILELYCSRTSLLKSSVSNYIVLARAY